MINLILVDVRKLLLCKKKTYHPTPMLILYQPEKTILIKTIYIKKNSRKQNKIHHQTQKSLSPLLFLCLFSLFTKKVEREQKKKKKKKERVCSCWLRFFLSVAYFSVSRFNFYPVQSDSEILLRFD